MLLVEDELLIRMSTADMIGDAGHEVLSAGSEALRILEEQSKRQPPVEILIADICLPDTTGV